MGSVEQEYLVFLLCVLDECQYVLPFTPTLFHCLSHLQHCVPWVHLGDAEPNTFPHGFLMALEVEVEELDAIIETSEL